jgi:hypothetical protein
MADGTGAIRARIGLGTGLATTTPGTSQGQAKEAAPGRRTKPVRAATIPTQDKFRIRDAPGTTVAIGGDRGT